MAIAIPIPNSKKALQSFNTVEFIVSLPSSRAYSIVCRREKNRSEKPRRSTNFYAPAAIFQNFLYKSHFRCRYSCSEVLFMQHNNKSKGFRSFVKEKGYYIVLLLCAVAVGTSAYFLLTRERPAEQTTVAPVIATEPTENGETVSESAAVRENAQENTSAARKPEAVTEPTAPKRLETARPLEGEAVMAFAVDHLAYNETTRDWRTHEGVDYRAEEGQEVCAAADGTVYAIYEDEGLGMTVVLQHADGYTTHYSNLNGEVSVSVGQSISRGDVLGLVGTTACVETAAVPHLHFAVYQNNSPVDPEEFFTNP